MNVKKTRQGGPAKVTTANGVKVIKPSTKRPLPRNSLSQANSPHKRPTTIREESYNDIASSLFDLGETEHLEDEFLRAAKDGNFAVVEKLLKTRSETLFNIDVRDPDTGNTALVWASKRAHIKIVQLLLCCGADVTLRNNEGQTAVEIASPKVQQVLLEGVDKGGPYRTLLQAAWQGHANLVKKILSENQLDINCKNADGLSALLLVTRDAALFEKLGSAVGKYYRPVEVVRELINQNADSITADSEGRTPLHHIASSKANIASRITQVLIDHSAVGVKDRRQFTPIHCAAQSGNVDVVIALLDGGADANSRGFAGTTPLHISALNGHDLVCTTLLKHGADVTLVDDSGLSPVDVAKSKRVKGTLKQAWIEACEGKATTSASQIRPVSRGDSNLGTGPKGTMKRSKSFPNKRCGEVIFGDGDQSDSSSCSDQSNDSSTVDIPSKSPCEPKVESVDLENCSSAENLKDTSENLDKSVRKTNYINHRKVDAKPTPSEANIKLKSISVVTLVTPFDGGFELSYNNELDKSIDGKEHNKQTNAIDGTSYDRSENLKPGINTENKHNLERQDIPRISIDSPISEAFTLVTELASSGYETGSHCLDEICPGFEPIFFCRRSMSLESLAALDQTDLVILLSPTSSMTSSISSLTSEEDFDLDSRRSDLPSTGSFDNIVPTVTAMRTKSSLLSNADRARIAEEQMFNELAGDPKHCPGAPFSVSVRGNARVHKSPQSSPRASSPPRSPMTNRKLQPLKQAPSPRRRDVKFTVGTKQHDGRTGGAGGGGVAASMPTGGKMPSLRKCATDPSRSLAATMSVMGMEMEEHARRPVNGAFHSRINRLRHNSGGDSPAPTPTPSDVLTLSEDFLSRGRSPSRLSVRSFSDETPDPIGCSSNVLSSSPPNRLHPLKTPSTPRINEESGDVLSRDPSRDRSPRRVQVLNLERMQLTQRRTPVNNMSAGDALMFAYPNSRRLLPPTPQHDDVTRTVSRTDGTLGSKDNSPRSDEDQCDVTPRLNTAMSVIREGNFRIEDTQVVHSSTDSGIPDDKGSSDSKNSSIESSVSNLSNGSNSNIAAANQNSASKTNNNNLTVCDKSDKGISIGVRQNTGFARADTGRSSERGPTSRVSTKSQGSAVSDNRKGSVISRSSSMGRTEQDNTSTARGQSSSSSRNLGSNPRSRSGPIDTGDLDLRQSTDSALSSRLASGRRSNKSAASNVDMRSRVNSTGATDNDKTPSRGNSTKSRAMSVTQPDADQSESSSGLRPTPGTRPYKHSKPIPSISAPKDSSAKSKTSSASKTTSQQPQVLQLKGGNSSEARYSHQNLPPRNRNTTVTTVQVKDDSHKSTTSSANTHRAGNREPNSSIPKMIRVQEALEATSQENSQAKATTSGIPKTNNSQKPNSKLATAAKQTAKPNKTSQLKAQAPKQPSLSPRPTTQDLSKPQSSNKSKITPTNSDPKPTTNSKPGQANALTPKQAFTNEVSGTLKHCASSPTELSRASDHQNEANPSKNSSPGNPLRNSFTGVTAIPGVKIQFNNGENPVAPPRKKRSPIDRSDSADSASSDKITDNHKIDQNQNIDTKDGRVPTATHTIQQTSQGGIPVKLATTKKFEETKSRGPVVMTEEHTGPKICDPFESLNAKRQKEIQDGLEKKRLEDELRQKSASKNRKPSKPDRQISATKNKRRTKSNSDDVKKRPKSSGNAKKRGKKSKKKTSETEEDKQLAEKADDNKVAFIGGIGWQIAADCNDRTDVQAVRVHSETESSDDDSDEEHEINIHVVPDYGMGNYRASTTLDFGSNSANYDAPGRRRSRDVVINLRRGIPGQVPVSESSSEEEDDESDFEDIPEYAEVVHDEVQYIFGQTSPVPPSRPNQCIELEDSDSEPDTKPKVLPLTDNALKTFENAMTRNELDNLLGPKYSRTDRNRRSQDESVVTNATKPNRNVTANSTRSKKESRQMSVEKTAQCAVNNKGNTAHNESRNDSNFRRVNSLPHSRKRQGGSSNQNSAMKNTSGRVRGISESQIAGEDPEIDSMIAEILKDTPNPSLTLTQQNGGQTKDVKARSMTREEFEDAINNDGGMSFRQVHGSNSKTRQASQSNAQKDNKSKHNQVDNSKTPPKKSIEEIVQDRTSEEHKELMDWKDKVDNLKEKERQEMERLMNTVKNMGLQVNLNSPRAAQGKSQSAFVRSSDYLSNASKPPIGPKPVPSQASPPKQSERLPEKSPRFVRRRDTLNKHNPAEHSEELSLVPDTMSSFGSIDLPAGVLAGDNRDSFVDPDRSEVVTSRLGHPKGGAGGGSRANSAMSNATDDNGDVIQWKRGNMLGKGAYGIVWCGLTNAGELIAVKQIELNITDMERTEAEYEKIQEEVDILKTLRHENIVGYLGTSLEENIVSIFMQFVPGGSIANLLFRFGALDEEVFCNYTKQILKGVEFLHANNVIHRDIKGGNIMTMQNGVIKLIDFGCAKRLCLNVSTKVSMESKSRLLKSMCGTPYWMAPEVVKETGHGTRSDIWSIGCTLYEMATRNPPWAEMPPMSAIFAIGSDSKPIPQLPEKCSSDARDFYDQCLTRDANKRPSASALLKHAFIMRRRKSRGNVLSQIH